MNSREERKRQLHEGLVKVIEERGFPREFGELIASSLGTEKTMQRMISYIVQFRPVRAEEIADEMLSIQAEFARYRRKKEAEYYNTRYNILLSEGLGEEDPKDE